MAIAPNIFGVSYLDTENYRRSLALFGVGMPLCDYPDTNDGNAKLALALQAASRMIDAECGKVFTPANLTETHELDLTTWRFAVNNPPVTTVISCVIRYPVDGVITIAPSRIYINNQKNYLEITRLLDASMVVLESIGTEIAGPQVEVVYQSLQTIPVHIRLACGFQTAHLINTGFVDKTLPPNFGKIDMGGLSINNKKGYRSSEEMQAGSFSPEALRLITPEKRFGVA